MSRFIIKFNLEKRRVRDERKIYSFMKRLRRLEVIASSEHRFNSIILHHYVALYSRVEARLPKAINNFSLEMRFKLEFSPFAGGFLRA